MAASIDSVSTRSRQGPHGPRNALVNLVALQPDEHIEAIIDTRTYEDGAYLFLRGAQRHGERARMSEYDSSLRMGLIAINLNGGDELVAWSRRAETTTFSWCRSRA